MKIEFTGKFLKADEVKKGATITIIDPGKEQESRFTYADGSPKTDYIFTVKYGEEEKSLRMNMTSLRAMSEAFGRETLDWVGKKAKLFVMPTPNGEHKMIVLDPVTDGWAEEE